MSRPPNLSGSSGAAPFVQGVPVDPDRVAGRQLVAHRVHHEHIVHAVAPPGVVLDLVQRGKAAGLQHHGGATHDCGQRFGTRVIPQPLCVDFFGPARRWQIGLVNPRADKGGMAVPVDFDHVRSLEARDARGGIQDRIVDPACIDHLHHAVDLVVEVRSETVDRFAPDQAFAGGVRRIHERHRLLSGLGEPVRKDVDLAVLPDPFFVERVPRFLGGPTSSRNCAAHSTNARTSPRVLTALAAGLSSAQPRHRCAEAGRVLRNSNPISVSHRVIRVMALFRQNASHRRKACQLAHFGEEHNHGIRRFRRSGRPPIGGGQDSGAVPADAGCVHDHREEKRGGGIVNAVNTSARGEAPNLAPSSVSASARAALPVSSPSRWPVPALTASESSAAAARSRSVPAAVRDLAISRDGAAGCIPHPRAGAFRVRRRA